MSSRDQNESSREDDRSHQASGPPYLESLLPKTARMHAIDVLRDRERRYRQQIGGPSRQMRSRPHAQTSRGIPASFFSPFHHDHPSHGATNLPHNPMSPHDMQYSSSMRYTPPGSHPNRGSSGVRFPNQHQTSRPGGPNFVDPRWHVSQSGQPWRPIDERSQWGPAVRSGGVVLHHPPGQSTENTSGQTESKRRSERDTERE